MVKGRSIWILDFEVAHYGHPSFDLAFFSTHFILKAVKNKQWAGAYLSMLEYMLDIYFSGIHFMSPSYLDRSFTKLLSLLMLARVDGKSPAEYIAAEEDRELVRALALGLIERNIDSYQRALPVLAEHIYLDKEKPRYAAIQH
jgi:aminoglycoside phosphotransferase (APT) family kinase protein